MGGVWGLGSDDGLKFWGVFIRDDYIIFVGFFVVLGRLFMELLVFFGFGFGFRS